MNDAVRGILNSECATTASCAPIPKMTKEDLEEMIKVFDASPKPEKCKYCEELIIQWDYFGGVSFNICCVVQLRMFIKGSYIERDWNAYAVLREYGRSRGWLNFDWSGK